MNDESLPVTEEWLLEKGFKRDGPGVTEMCLRVASGWLDWCPDGSMGFHSNGGGYCSLPSVFNATSRSKVERLIAVIEST